MGSSSYRLGTVFKRTNWRSGRFVGTGLALSLLAVGWLGCGEPPESYDNATDGEVAVIGHGGAGFRSRVNRLPTNSMRSIKAALDGLGADGVEVDVQLSADGTLVLFHDAKLDQDTDCTGCVLGRTDEELGACRYHTSIVAPLGKADRIITLRDLLYELAARPHPPILMLDIKHFVCPSVNPAVYDDQMIAGILALLREFRAESWVFIQSGNASFLRKLRIEDLNIQIHFDGTDMPSAIGFAFDYRLNGLVFQVDAVTREEVRLAQDAGLPVSVFGVRSRVSALKALRLEPDAVLTDDILLVRELLGK